MPQLVIDNLPIEVPAGTKVIAAAERLGIIIPRFCYHPGLGSFGACRMCAVKFLAGPVKGVEMSCMVEAADGMVVSTTDPEAVGFRRQVIEWLMLNHPHDCPVCDEGGHCLLQDETVAGGHGLRRYLGPKRTYLDQDLGVFVQHEMNRCIQCWRCRNFYQGFAGYRDFGAMQIANRTYFGRYRPGALESPFSGNLIDVCPTGVLTDKPARYQGRRWDLERAPSLCLHCSLGCNTVAGARYREVLRQEGRFNDAVNGYFLCDRGRFGHYFANQPDRPRRARQGEVELPRSEALKAAAAQLAEIAQAHGPQAVAYLGSCRSSLETQGLLTRLCRQLGWQGPSFFLDQHQGAKVSLAVAALDKTLAVSLREVEQADFVLVVGADPVNEAPMLALALRQAQRRGAAVMVLDPRPVFLPLAFQHLPLAPGELDLALKVVGQQVSGPASREDPAPVHPDPARQAFLTALGDQLAAARRPVLVCGTDVVRLSTVAQAGALARRLRAKHGSGSLFYVLPGANASGAALLTNAFPASASAADNLAESPGQDLLNLMESGAIKALLVVESDPWQTYPDRERLRRALAQLDLLIVLDYLPSPTAARADIFLPTLTIFEAGGSFVNQEGRVQSVPALHQGGLPLAQAGEGGHPPREFHLEVPGGEPRAAGEMLAALAGLLSEEAPGTCGQDLWTWLSRGNPVFDRAGDLGDHPAGRRLLPETAAALPWPEAGPSPWPSEDLPPDHLELLLVDLTFGTEELSNYSPPVQQAEKPPFLLLNPEEAESLGLKRGDLVSLPGTGGSLAVPVAPAPNLARGVLVLPRHRLLDWQKFPPGPIFIPKEALRPEK